MEWLVEQKMLCAKVHEAPFKQLKEYADAAFEKGRPLGDHPNYSINTTDRENAEYAMDIPPLFDEYVRQAIHNNFMLHKAEMGVYGIDETKLQVVKMWANKMRKGDQHQLHTHSFSLYSFSVYLDVVENDAPFVFVNEAQVSPVYINGNSNQHILIFPSKLLHTVYPKLNDGVRVSVSGNVVINPFGVPVNP